LNNVPLPLVTKPKFVVEALQWSSERRAQVQSYVNETELTSELNQNRRQKVFTRGLCVSAGDLLVCAGGIDTLKIDKNSADL